MMERTALEHYLKNPAEDEEFEDGLFPVRDLISVWPRKRENFFVVLSFSDNVYGLKLWQLLVDLFVEKGAKEGEIICLSKSEVEIQILRNITKTCKLKSGLERFKFKIDKYSWWALTNPYWYGPPLSCSQATIFLDDKRLRFNFYREIVLENIGKQEFDYFVKKIKELHAGFKLQKIQENAYLMHSEKIKLRISLPYPLKVIRYYLIDELLNKKIFKKDKQILETPFGKRFTEGWPPKAKRGYQRLAEALKYDEDKIVAFWSTQHDIDKEKKK